MYNLCSHLVAIWDMVF